MKREALFIGGTGTISMAITRSLAQNEGWHLTLLNRGNRKVDITEGVDVINVDINDEERIFPNVFFLLLGEKEIVLFFHINLLMYLYKGDHFPYF